MSHDQELADAAGFSAEDREAFNNMVESRRLGIEVWELHMRKKGASHLAIDARRAAIDKECADLVNEE